MAFGVLVATPPPAHAQSCTFVLGFATLHSMIPTITGNCVNNESHTANSDGLQNTVNGLMVWRKADNFTAFTNGSQTWINGPFGIQTRPNNDRFAWEVNQAKVAGTKVITFVSPHDRRETGFRNVHRGVDRGDEAGRVSLYDQ